jgi:uncharacterized protein YehS (DUF1456 family)
MNNDVIRKIRYIEDFSDRKMMGVFKLAELEVSRERLSQWLKKDKDPDFLRCSDVELATFLNGFIIKKRGKRDGEQPKPEQRLTNNIVLKKLVIAYNLKADEVIEILKIASFSISKHELSAFFRKPDHKNYRVCKAQVLRNFLMGLQVKLRPNQPEKV